MCEDPSNPRAYTRIESNAAFKKPLRIPLITLTKWFHPGTLYIESLSVPEEQETLVLENLCTVYLAQLASPKPWLEACAKEGQGEQPLGLLNLTLFC